MEQHDVCGRRPPGSFDLARGITAFAIEGTFARDVAEGAPEEREQANGLRARLRAMQAPPDFWRGFASACLLAGGAARGRCSRGLAAARERLILLAGFAIEAALDPESPGSEEGRWLRFSGVDPESVGALPPDRVAEKWDRHARREALGWAFWVGFFETTAQFLAGTKGLVAQGNGADREIVATGATCLWVAARRLVADPAWAAVRARMREGEGRSEGELGSREHDRHGLGRR